MSRLGWILLLALILRLGWALSRSSEDVALEALPDQVEYVNLGRSITAGEGLTMVDPRFPGPVYAFRTPAYPFLVAACLGKLQVVRAVQALMDTSTVLAVFLLARRIAPDKAWVAALLAALCPFLIYFTGLLLTETFFTALLVWGVVLLAKNCTRSFLGGVLLLALAVLVRPGALGLPIALAFAAGLARSRLPRVPVMLTAVMLTALVLLPWGWRNKGLLNEWIFTSTNAGITAYDGFNPAADGSSNQGAFVPHLPELSEMTETQRNNYLNHLASTWRSEHPRRSLELAAIKAARTWSPFPLSDQNRQPALIAVGLAYCTVTWVLAVIGITRNPAGGRGYKFLLLVPAIYLTLAAMASVGSLRYRIPAEPLLAVLAAGGAAVVTSSAQRKTPAAEAVGLTFERKP